MKKTLLYKDITTEKIFTFSELKNEYEFANDCEMEIDDATMDSIIYENLACVGGNIEIISNNDEILKWCNDYCEYMNGDRVLSQEEKDNSLRDLYEAIANKTDKWLIDSAKENVYCNELLERLEKLLEEF